MMEPDEQEESSTSTGIQVYLRIRPSSCPSGHFQLDDIDVKTISFKIPKQEDKIVNNSKNTYKFQFSGILDDKVTQKDVFKTVGIPAIKNALEGYNSTIFAYGCTGSGKTFTITGGTERYDDRGIIPRSLSYLFKIFKTGKPGIVFSCYISYLEIYNQSGYDLLMEADGNNDVVPKVTMLEDEMGNFHFKNLSMHAVSSEEDALNLLFLGDTNRAIAATEMNENSTRSHCIFTIMLEGRKSDSDTVIRSKCSIVDLAGSERVSRTSSAGQTLTEAKYINSSLFFLEMVIVALYEKQKKRKDNIHIPYRNSMMTSVLRDSLGGNCKTTMIATISPEAAHTDESISTCQFAQRVALTKNTARINEEVDPEVVIQRLRAEVKRLRDEVAFLSGKDDDDSSNDGEEENATLPQNKIDELTEAVDKYIHDQSKDSHLDFCGGISLHKIKAVHRIFKDIILSGRRVNNRSDGDEEDDGTIENGTLLDESQSDEEAHDTSDIAIGKNRVYKQRPSVTLEKRQASQGKRRLMDQRKSSHQAGLNPCIKGVPRCRDACILDDPNAAFAWFKERYPGLSTIDENNNILRRKISDAKSIGKRVETIRSRIDAHKLNIEKTRKNHAISLISGRGELREQLEKEEKQICDAIASEKVAYKDALEQIRELKGGIEHIQRLIEKNRQKMQLDFDTWYHEMCGTDDVILNDGVEAETNQTEGQLKQMASKAVNESTTTSLHHPSPASTPSHTSTSMPTETNQSRQNEKSTGKNFELPPEVKLTGIKEVDDDIIAFYQAKELMKETSLSRR